MPDTEAMADALIVAPEPADWLAPLLDELGKTLSVEVFAPWVLPSVLTRHPRAPGFVRRRDGRGLCGARGQGWFTAAELLARSLARGKTAPTLANRVRMRVVVDAAAAVHLGRRDVPSVVVAPSFAARRTFAAAEQAGSRCLLVEDMPDFDGLVDGLDALASQLPQATFLRNHRPSARAHARQRAERWLTDAVAVRGRVAWSRIGTRRHRVLLPRAARPQRHDPGGDILFAGPPLARAGSTHLPALLEALPGRTLRVPPGPCSEPASLLRHPRVRVDRSLAGVGVVLSLGALESHPGSVAWALDAGVPVVGTLASTGLLEPSSIVSVAPQRVHETAAAIEGALRGEAPKPRAWTPPATVTDWLASCGMAGASTPAAQ